MEVPRDDTAWDLTQIGWQWLIFGHLVEKQWPMLPSMLQGALNSANAISKAANELELAAQLANLFQHGVPLKEAKSKAQASTTVEPQLLVDLCHFITQYAGGDTFPFIDFLQKFSALPVFVPFGIKPKPCGISCVITVYICSPTLFPMCLWLLRQELQHPAPSGP